MEKVSLYRKYRPHNFDNLVGQDHIKTTLINAIKNKKVAHAYLLTGPRGTGKTSTARLIAKALNCTALQEDFEPCDACEFCVDINEGRLIDLIEIDAASNRGIDEVRDLKEKINFAPTRSKYKVYIIDEVHMMTKEAFNALLKTLEEPPEHAYFILATTEVHKIPETIISRCQRFDFKRISMKALLTRLSFIAQMENIQAEDEALESISRYVDGGLRDAIGLLEQLTTNGVLSLEHVQEILGISSHNLISVFKETLKNNDTAAALKVVQDLYSQGSDLKQFTHEFINTLREDLLQAVAQTKDEEVRQLLNMINVFQDAKDNLGSTSIPQLPLEIAAIKLTRNLPEEVPITAPPVMPINTAKAPPKKETPREHKKIVSTEPTLQPLTFENIKENWPRVMERIKTPALRMSLKSAVPVELEGLNLVLQFDTNFHKEKVMEAEHREELETTMKEIFNVQPKISAKVKELELNPQAPAVSDIGNALEILGGEIVE